MIPYVKTQDDTIILQTSKGPKFISLDSFNYWKIRKKLPDITEEELLPLLETPDITNGIYKIYSLGKHLIIIQIKDDATIPYILDNGILKMLHKNITIEDLKVYKYIGVFTSTSEIKEYFPEYFI